RFPFILYIVIDILDTTTYNLGKGEPHAKRKEDCPSA
ncbi:unnamed protein product, partial [marine sediment metagenome]